MNVTPGGIPLERGPQTVCFTLPESVISVPVSARSGRQTDVVDDVINGRADDDQIALAGAFGKVGFRRVDVSAGDSPFRDSPRPGRSR